MARLDTPTKFHQFAETPVAQKQAYVEVHEMAEGGVELVLEDATLKSFNKKWHTSLGSIVLTPEQRAALKAVL